MREDIETPAYVFSSDGFKTSVSYEDDWCYGKSEHIVTTASDEEARAAVKEHIRRKTQERNGIPCYMVSDHGNVHRTRAIRLRKV